MKANEIFSDFFAFCWIILNFMTLEFNAFSMSDWMSQSESKDLCIILHFFRFVQIFPEIFRYIQIYSDIFGYFAIFPYIFRFIEILLDLSGYIYLCWHKTRAKGNFVQWITLYLSCILSSFVWTSVRCWGSEQGGGWELRNIDCWVEEFGGGSEQRVMVACSG